LIKINPRASWKGAGQQVSSSKYSRQEMRVVEKYTDSSLSYRFLNPAEYICLFSIGKY